MAGYALGGRGTTVCSERCLATSQGRPLARRYPTNVVPADELDQEELTPT